MSELILYYSHGGATKKYAEKYASETGATVIEVQESKKRSGLGQWCPGTVQAIAGSKSKIKPIDADLDSFDKILLAAPIWCGNPAPAINSAADLVPAGKEVAIILVSGGGGGNADKLSGYVKAKNSEVTEVIKVKASEI